MAEYKDLTIKSKILWWKQTYHTAIYPIHLYKNHDWAD